MVRYGVAQPEQAVRILHGVEIKDEYEICTESHGCGVCGRHLAWFCGLLV